ncbi:biotin--[acetyl-CoA-carboxylase] ligase [Helicobacter cappadocius]|uniref:Biotin--[acetyl-CoA-carboxylase] ligase n=1 Tax=Helicobacter cappadocius TaxID=3063998 RepID=A0AA90T989_9HELI|nr:MULTISPECIES: biotin--[acetyl-CoA-carboxylase] ligase [unclassified Helicobacter]MDO7252744.1 biotin--[acetyl-CoA-carboxylase] ligase [Helicobacter sp. faydin-H75]MDP2538612.1 biotin--[acetyl-CoA-carboxylase] ligase [Helicobacter sp. faydin-H76]
MKIIDFDELPSTQTYLVENLRSGLLKSPICIVAKKQSAGIGSRGNDWKQVENALTFSFSYEISSLPQDLPTQSASIFFGFIFKETLASMGFDVWLKWPNDVYFEDRKIAGIIVNVWKNNLVCGIGLNISASNFASLKTTIDKKAFLEIFFEKIKNTLEWKDIFSKYELEFYKNFSFSFHHQNRKIDLQEAKLCSDGGIEINGEKIYSFR